MFELSLYSYSLLCNFLLCIFVLELTYSCCKIDLYWCFCHFNLVGGGLVACLYYKCLYIFQYHYIYIIGIKMTAVTIK